MNWQHGQSNHDFAEPQKLFQKAVGKIRGESKWNPEESTVLDRPFEKNAYFRRKTQFMEPKKYFPIIVGISLQILLSTKSSTSQLTADIYRVSRIFFTFIEKKSSNCAYCWTRDVKSRPQLLRYFNNSSARFVRSRLQRWPFRDAHTCLHVIRCASLIPWSIPPVELIAYSIIWLNLPVQETNGLLSLIMLTNGWLG